ATSNICSNQALNALASSVAMSSIGKHGLKKMAMLNMHKARYLKQEIESNGISVVTNGAFFNEFVIKLPTNIAEVNKKLLDKGIVGGYDLGSVYPTLENHMLIAVTEIRTKEEIDTFVKELGEIIHG